MLNGITVHLEGKARHLELNEKQAEKLYWFTLAASTEDSVADSVYPLSNERREKRVLRCNTVEEAADNFRTHLSMMAKLDTRDTALVVAFLDLIEYGDSWMLKIIKDLLSEVLCEGPASALAENPREVLADVAYELYDWWDTIDTARSRVEQHPELFALRAPEPPATPETTTHPASTLAKAQPTRKPRKKVAHTQSTHSDGRTIKTARARTERDAIH